MMSWRSLALAERTKEVKRETLAVSLVGLLLFASALSWSTRCSNGSEERTRMYSVRGVCLDSRRHGTKAWWYGPVMSRAWESSLHFSMAWSLAYVQSQSR